MGTPSTLAQLTAISKMLYKDGAGEIGFTDTPAFGQMKKTSDFFGESKAFSSRYGKTPGASRDFATSRGNAGNSPYARWIVTRSMDFVTVQIGVSAYEALGNNRGAQVAYVEDECKSAYDRCMQRLERNVFRGIGGAIVQIASGGGTNVLTVTNPEELVALDVNMRIESSTDDGSLGVSAGAGVDAGGSKIIGSIDRINGTLTRSGGGNWNAGGGFADGSYIFIAGDYGLALTGLDSWIPPTVPGSSDSFYALNRSVDERLYGIRYEAASGEPDGSVLRAIVNAATLCQHHGGKPDKIFMNTLDFGRWVNDLGNNAMYTTSPGQGVAGKKLDVSYSGVRVMLPGGEATVHSSRYVPRYTVWGLDYSDLTFEGMKETPRWMNLDGNKWFRMSPSDLHAVEGYLYYEGQFVLRNPGNHFRLDITDLFA